MRLSLVRSDLDTVTDARSAKGWPCLPRSGFVTGRPAQRGVLVQAEEVGGMRAFGFRALGGGEVIATEAELDLLGTVKPG